MRPFRAAHIAAAAAIGLTPVATTQAADFYAGKTITFSTHTGAGGEYDAYLRQLARFIGKHIPGHPSAIVLNQPGAGGLLAVNFAAKRAPQDGTFITLVANGLLLFQALGAPGLEVSLGDFKWIGNFNASNAITVAMTTSGVHNVHEAMQHEVIIGSTGAGSVSYLLPVIQNILIGTKFKVVAGYKGTAMMVLAMRRGEIQGRSGASWHDYTTEFPEELKAGKLIALTQIGNAPDPQLPNVPMLADLVRGDPKKEQAAHLVSLAVSQTRSLAAPPGVPDDRVAILRKAFDDLAKDKEFRKALKQNVLPFNPVSGEKVQATVREVLATPKDAVDILKGALDIKGK
jgi:tripartite-type tricarboxylate transporter receptor subunit TctC